MTTDLFSFGQAGWKLQELLTLNVVPTLLDAC